MIRVLELFAGIGAFSEALTQLGIEHEIVDAVENDRFAIASFNAIHGTNFEPQDIREWDKDVECDIIMHGSPCQDFSVAGKGAGGDEGSGTRSSLMYETLRIVENLRPPIVIWENVKNILSKKHRHNFDNYLNKMEELGYRNYYQVLNAKDYGVPQNRERVFTISLLDNKLIYDAYNARVRADQDTIGTLTTNCGSGSNRAGWKIIEKGFEFPAPFPLAVKLKDVLENEVDEKYYLSDEQVSRFKYSSFNQAKTRLQKKEYCDALLARDFKDPKLVNIDASRGRNPDNPSDRTAGCPTEQRLEINKNGTSNSLTSVQKDNLVVESVMPIKTANIKGYDLAKDGDGIDLAYPKSETRRGRVGHEKSSTLQCSNNAGVLDGTRIRKLTPRECWRLMSFTDESFEKAARVNSNTQLYKQAGNSIVVDVLKEIIWNLGVDNGQSN